MNPAPPAASPNPNSGPPRADRGAAGPSPNQGPAAPGEADRPERRRANDPPVGAAERTAPDRDEPAATPGERPLAHLAADPSRTRGRLHAEDDRAERGPRDAFQRDRDRIIHSVPFRRLRHKTQVFVAPGRRPLPGAAHPQPRGRPDRADAGAGARAQRGSDRGARARPRYRPPALRPCRRGRAPGGDGGGGRLRSQCPYDPAADPARKPLSALRRIEPELGDARGPRQA